MSTYGGNDPRAVRTDVPATGSSAGHDVTSRMAGTNDRRHAADGARIEPGVGLMAKTSAGAVFALVFGLAALFCALTAILAPVAVLFGIIGIILGIGGMTMTKRPGVTGRGVAIGGLVTAVIGLLLGAAVIAGVSVLVNDEQRLDQLQNEIDELREDLPSTSGLRDGVRN